MAVSSNLVARRLQVQVNGESTSGKQVTKSINLSKIRNSATDEQLYEAGKAVSELQTLPLSSIRTISTSELAEEG